MKYLSHIILILLICDAYGQDITFKNINTNDGLSSNLVYDACQGPDGLLWILANRRLDSYNEGKVTNYTNDIIPNIEDYKWAEIMIDTSNIIWLRSLNRELLYLDHNRTLHKLELTDLFSDGILNFIRTDSGTVDIIALEGQFHFDIQNQMMDTIHLFEDPIYTSPALQISDEGNGDYVFNANNKAILYDADKGKVKYIFDDVRTHGAVMINAHQMLVSTANHHELFLVDVKEDKIIKNLALDILKDFPEINTYYRRIKHLDSDHVGITSGHQGLFILNVNDLSVKNYAHDFANPSSISSDNSYFLYTGSNGNVFVTSRTSGLNIFNQGRKNAKHIRALVDQADNSIFQGHISHLAKDSKGLYWLASSQGLLKYNPASGSMQRNVRDKAENEILGLIGLYIDTRDRVFLGVSGGGLEILDNRGKLIKTFRNRKNQPNSLKSNFVYSFMKGLDGKLWIGTSRGINILNLNTLELEPLELEDPLKILNTSIRELRMIDKEIFIGTWRKGGYVLTENGFQKIEIPQDYAVANVTDFGKDLTGRLFFGSENGLFLFKKDNSANKYTFIEKLMDGRILSIDRDRSGNIWVSTENVLYKYESGGKDIEEFTTENGFTGGGFRMHGSYMDKDGLLHYGLNTGMCYFDPEDLGKNEIELNPHITGAFQDENKMLISSDTYINLPSTENNIGVYYQNIDIWNNPILQYEYSVSNTVEEWTPALTNPILIQNIGYGVYDVKIRASMDGRNWVEAPNKISACVDFPWWRSWWFYTLAFIAVLCAIYAAIRFYSILKADKLEEKKYDESLKFFSFSMHKYADMDKEFWDVILECIHQLDIDACAIFIKDIAGMKLHRNAISIKSLKDKDYSKRPAIISIDEGIIGSVAKTGKSIVINDTSLENGEFRDMVSRKSKLCVPIISSNQLLGVIDCEHDAKDYFNERRLSFISAISTIVATKIVAYNAEEERKEAEISLSDNLKKVSQLEMKSLRSQMNPHFMFNSLNSINNFIVKNDQENASDYLTSFAQLMRIILENSRQDWVPLESELSALRLYIGMEKLRFENQFFYHESIADNINVMTTLVPPMLIQPYIENAIWHGLLPKKSEHCNLRLILKNEGDILHIIVEDDGIGTKVSQRKKSDFKVAKKSFGLKIIAERLDMINKIYNLDAGVEIVDKSDLSETETGTKVTLSMKLKMTEK